MKFIFQIFIYVPFLLCVSSLNIPNKPHIIIITAEDLGYNDVGFHGSNEIPTPNIDALAYNGIILNRHYVEPMSTPTRASLMTGKYSSKIGMQRGSIGQDQPWGLPLNHKTMANYLSDAGYKTHLIGKWHLGFYRKKYTPTHRGFDTHFGSFGERLDYFDHRYLGNNFPYPTSYGMDLRNNLTIDYGATGSYMTHLITTHAINKIGAHNKNKPLFMHVSHVAVQVGMYPTDKLQAPHTTVEEFNHIRDVNRRIYAAMVSELDKSVGRIVNILSKNKMLENSIILFTSINGAPSGNDETNYGSNFPLRGVKYSPFEGAIRSVAAIWSPHLIERQRVSNQLIHISDWLPTFGHLAKTRFKKSDNIDGLDVWFALSKNTDSPRSEIFYFDDENFNYRIVKNIKYIQKFNNVAIGLYDKRSNASGNGNTNPNGYGKRVSQSLVGTALYPFSVQSVSKHRLDEYEILRIRNESILHCHSNGFLIPCTASDSNCVFDIQNDPCEMNNIAASTNSDTQSERRLTKFQRNAITPLNKLGDYRSDPSNFGYIWTYWYDQLNINERHESYTVCHINIT